jgi:hypothetical protein
MRSHARSRLSFPTLAARVTDALHRVHHVELGKRDGRDARVAQPEDPKGRTNGGVATAPMRGCHSTNRGSDVGWSDDAHSPMPRARNGMDYAGYTA